MVFLVIWLLEQVGAGLPSIDVSLPLILLLEQPDEVPDSFMLVLLVLWLLGQANAALDLLLLVLLVLWLLEQVDAALDSAHVSEGRWIGIRHPALEPAFTFSKLIVSDTPVWTKRFSLIMAPMASFP